MELIVPGTNGKVINTVEPGRYVMPGTVKMRVTAAMCVHRGVKVPTFHAMRELEKVQDPKFEFNILEGDALIDRSRGRMATHWMKKNKDVDYLLFLDDDIVYDPRDLQRMMLVMKHHDLDILGAAYATKADEGATFAIRTLTGNESIPFGREGLIQRVRYVSTGCMAIHRRVFQKMIEDGEKRPDDPNAIHFCHPSTKEFSPFFMPMQHKDENGRWLYLSEDWAFCQRAIDLGFKVYCDTTIKLHHIGDKIYNWDDIIKQRKEVFDKMLYVVDHAID